MDVEEANRIDKIWKVLREKKVSAVTFPRTNQRGNARGTAWEAGPVLSSNPQLRLEPKD